MARTAEQLLANGLAVIDAAFVAGATAMLPLFSGGHDSLSACFVASRHRRFGGGVHHIDTGIGAAATRRFVDEVCAEFGWSLVVWRSKATFERFVCKLGFPGPGAHQWVYNWLKDRCVGQMTRGKWPKALITGCRSHESTRRMGHTAPVKVGETSKKTGVVSKLKRVWTAPCHDWTTDDQQLFMAENDLPRNQLKDSPIAMSGECFCGAFARPGELDLIRCYAPDVAAEIDRLKALAVVSSTHCEWGKRRSHEKGIVAAETGQLCSSCDRKAALAGIVIKEA